MFVYMRLKEVLRELFTTKNHGSFSALIFYDQWHWSPGKKLEYPKGLHGRERGSFLWVIQDEGKEI
jgi:hypothetical protein